MKLFVTGVESPDPDQWSLWDEFSLVLAESAEEAQALTGESPDSIFEVNMRTARILVRMPEPQQWDDL